MDCKNKEYMKTGLHFYYIKLSILHSGFSSFICEREVKGKVLGYITPCIMWKTYLKRFVIFQTQYIFPKNKIKYSN